MDLSQARWRKSTFSGPETDCVEVAFVSLTHWRKSTHSTDISECVEVAFVSGEVGVRDSKNPAGGALVLPEPAWRVFAATAPSSAP